MFPWPIGKRESLRAAPRAFHALPRAITYKFYEKVDRTLACTQILMYYRQMMRRVWVLAGAAALSLATSLSVHATPPAWTKPDVRIGGDTVDVNGVYELLLVEATRADGTSGDTSGVISTSYPGTEGSTLPPNSVPPDRLDGSVVNGVWTPYTNVSHATEAYLLDLPSTAHPTVSTVGQLGVFGGMIPAAETAYHTWLGSGSSSAGASRTALAFPSEGALRIVWNQQPGLTQLPVLFRTLTTFTYQERGYLDNGTFVALPVGNPPNNQTIVWEPRQGSHYSARVGRIGIRHTRNALTQIISIDSRIVYGIPDRTGVLVADPNLPATHVNFFPWDYSGGLFVGRSAPGDKSGEARIQFQNSVLTPAQAGATATGSLITKSVSLFGLGSPPGYAAFGSQVSLFPLDPNPAPSKPVDEMTWFDRWEFPVNRVQIQGGTVGAASPGNPFTMLRRLHWQYQTWRPWDAPLPERGYGIIALDGTQDGEGAGKWVYFANEFFVQKWGTLPLATRNAFIPGNPDFLPRLHFLLREAASHVEDGALGASPQYILLGNQPWQRCLWAVYP